MKPSKDADGFPVYPNTTYSMARLNGMQRMRALGTDMPTLATTLSNILRLPVLDVTGLEGKFDLVATFTQESIGQAPPEGSVPGLTLFEAFEKERGLHLERKA